MNKPAVLWMVLRGDPCFYDRYQWLRTQLRGGPLRTLDAGCGGGALTMYAASRGNNALGISFQDENNVAATQRARRLGITNVAFVTGDLRALHTFGPGLGTFDQVICFECIEHIMDDQKLVKDLSARLKKGGRLLLTTPYKHYRRLAGDRITPVENGDHVRWGYTHEEMRVIFDKAGIDMVHATYVSGVVSQWINTVMRVLRKVEPHLAWGLTLPLRILRPLDAPLSRIMRYPYLSIAVVGVKRGS